MEVKEEKITRKEFYEKFELTHEYIKSVLDNVKEIVDNMIEKFGSDKFPAANSINLVYPAVDNLDFSNDVYESSWTTGFWSGIIWLMYEYTHDEKYKKIGQRHTELFRQRIDNYNKGERKIAQLDHHDLGFLYCLSTVADYKLTGSKYALETSEMAAKILTNRYIDKVGILQAWGDMNDENQRGRLIIDCNLNIPLLYFIAKETGNQKYYDMAYSHVKKASQYIVREDASTYHTYFMDTNTGKPRFGKTHQGYSDNSCWARGQAWGIMGFPLSYDYTKDQSLIDLSIKLSNYFLNRLPEDFVCDWDIIFTDDKTQRDSSAAAIAAIGMLKIARDLDDTNEYKQVYLNAVNYITSSLVENYLGKNKEGLLLHGVYFFKGGLGVDEYTMFGDYFFVELLMRLYNKDWKQYW